LEVFGEWLAIGVLNLFMSSFTMKFDVLAQLWFLQMCRGLALIFGVGFGG